MIAGLLLAAMASSASSPFVGEWSCSSVFLKEPLSLTLIVAEDDEGSSVTILRSTDTRLPDGPVRLFGKPERLANNYASELIPDLRWDGQVLNSDGDVSFKLNWDREDGISVDLRQYFSDGTPSKFVGGLACTGVEE